ncbi:hypothetical protein ABIB06_006545 [Bradyrhizobium sp. LB8.2]
MSSAMGILMWSPKEFWDATVYEYTSAMKGYLRSKGINTVDPVSRNEFLAMKREEEGNKRKRGN